MKNIHFSIPRNVIEAEIGETTAYSGFKADEREGETFRRVATVAEDSRLLGGFLSQACGTAADKLRNSIIETAYDGKNLSASLEVSDAFPDTMSQRAEIAFKDFAVAFATTRWMRLAWPAKAAEWDEEAQRRLLELDRILCLRRAPKRTVKPNATISFTDNNNILP